MVWPAGAFRLLCNSHRQSLHIFSAFYLLIAGLFLIAPLGDIAGAATYYVDAVNGSDSNLGSESEPWKTTTKAGNTAVAGDTVLFKPGTYTAQLAPTHSGSEGSMITFKAQTRRTAILDGGGASSVAVDLRNKSYVRIEGFAITNWAWQKIFFDDGNNIEIVDNYIYGGGDYGIGRSPRWTNSYITIEDNEITGVQTAGILLGGEDIIVRGNYIHDLPGDGMDCGGDRWLIEDNIIGRFTGEQSHNDGISTNRLSNAIIRYNTIYDWTQEIYFNSDSYGTQIEDVSIYGNLFYTVNYYNNGGGSAPGILINAARDDASVVNLIIHSNTFAWLGTGTASLGIYTNVATEVSNIKVYDNIFYSNGFNADNAALGNINSDYNLWYLHAPPAWEGAHSITIADPYFVDYQIHDGNHVNFHLKSTSAGIDAGNPSLASDVTLPSPFLDLDVHARPLDIPGVGHDGGGAFDIGAYEYSGPTADAGLDQSIKDSDDNGSEQVTLDGSGSTDPDGTIVSYVWTKGSTQIATGITATVTLPVGQHTITLTVTDDEGLTDTDTVVISVKPANEAPIADAGPDQTLADSDGNGSEQVTLDGSGSSDPDGTITSYVWTEGGTQIATGAKPTVVLSVGQHTITLTVTDNGGLTDTDTIVITVNESGTNQPPSANAGPDQTLTDNDGNGSEQTTLNGSGSTDPDGTIQSYVWREGGSQIATGANPTVTLSVGQHTITLTVIDNGGLTDTDTVTIAVNASGSTDNNPPSVTNCSPAPDSIQVPLNNLITLHIVDAGKGVDASTVTIQVSGDTVYPGNNNCRRTGTQEEYTFTYQADEKFDYEQEITVTVNAVDLAKNVMDPCSYSFWTEMRSFGKNKKVSSGLDKLSCAAPATVCDSSGNIYVVWHAGPIGSRDVYLSKLEFVEGAGSFGSSVQLTTDSADQCNPAIAVDGSDKLYVVWQDNRRGNWDIYMSSSADWSIASPISDSNNNEINPAIAIGSAGRAAIAWQDNRAGNQDIHIASSSDGFATKAVSQITANASDQIDPAVAVDSANTVYVVWTDKRNGSNDIYGAASNSGPWTNVPIVNKAGNQSSPAIAAETAGSILHLLWVDDASGNSDIYHAATNGLPSTPVTGSSIMDDSSGRNQVEPAIAVTGSTGNNLEVFACWQDRRNIAGAIGDTDLYFAEVRSDGGTNIFVGDDSTNSNQSQPAIGVDAQGHPYLVWSDSRSANAQIYYAGSTYLDSEAVDSELVVASAGATVGVNPASIDSVEDVSVTVPAGACPCDIRITISEIKNPQGFTVPCLAAYDFGPSGIQFNQPVTITIPYAVPASQGSVTPYWFNSLTGALSQQGITDIKDIVVSPTLHAVSFKTTHFTPFYVVEGTAGGTGGGGGGGGCSVSATGNGSIVEFLLPYVGLAAAMMILRLRDAHQRKERRLTKSES